ncbi:hypothetical protein E4T49_00725 [Aureobasidium sp. EXF-10728]|nr:hypothetical protein E4T49_00725 [Aureobasidium sp. EXF-10728]
MATSSIQAQTPSQSRPPRIVTAMQTGLAYDVELLSPPSLKNATEGLRNNSISMVRCYERNNDFHFELQERIHVIIPNKGDPTCSICPINERRACRHIWWVDDQILSTAVPPKVRSRFRYQISPTGEAVREAEDEETLIFHTWLQKKGLGNLAQHAGWWKQDPMDQQDTRLVEQTATHILSTFEPCGVLSKQHGQDNFEMLQQESQALFARYKNEMIKQVKSQPFMLIALGAAVPEAERDLLHLTKIHSRIERIFFDFGYWMAMRTPSDSNLDATAKALYIEVDRLRSFMKDRGQQKMAISLQTRIAGILLYTLEQLVQHAGDIQTHAAVPIPQYSGLSLQDRSLLHKMINRKSPDFVLLVLDLLDSELLYSDMIQERVEALANGLRGGDEPCPAEYVQMLERVVGLDE